MHFTRALTACLISFVSVPIVLGQDGRLSEGDQQLLKALVAANEAAVDAAASAEMKVESVFRTSSRKYELNADVTWDGDRALFDYQLSVQAAEGASESDPPVDELSGKLLDTPRMLVDFQESVGKAFRSTERYKMASRVFDVLPRASWLSYDLEFPLREVLTADETWDYGNRNVTLKRSGDVVTLTLSSPGTAGELRVEFGADGGGLIRSVRHTGPKGPRYYADYQWAEVDGIWYPKSLRMHSLLGGDFRSRPRLDVKILAFQPRWDIPASIFAESSLKIDDTVEVTTFREGAEPVVRKPKPVAVETRLRELGKTLSEQGFAAGER